MRLLLIICVSLAVAGCSKSEEEVKQERKEELMKQFLNQKRDNRTLEQKVREAQKQDKASEK